MMPVAPRARSNGAAHYDDRVANLFHVSSAANRESILAHGLDWTRMRARGIAGSAKPEASGVFLCRDEFEASFFVRMNNTGGPVDVWAVTGVDADELVDGGSGFGYWPARIPPRQVTLSAWPPPGGRRVGLREKGIPHQVVPVLLRDARREDVPEIVALLADDLLGAGREGPADDAYFAAFEQIEADPRSRLLVAERDGRVVGTLQLTMLRGLSRHGMLRGQIEAVRVAADQRGQRLGRQMIEWAIEVAKGQGCGLLQLTSDKQRHDALRFYESLGFTASHEGLKLPLDRV